MTPGSSPRSGSTWCPRCGRIPSSGSGTPGCSTGEETYSLAILLREVGLYDRSRIYATDINEAVLASAAEGIYPLAKMQEFTENYLARRGLAVVLRTTTARRTAGPSSTARSRRTSSSPPHNLVSDRSFNEFHVIVCRNVLIYFDRTLQEHVHRLFLDSLVPFGVLALGRKETLAHSAAGERFDVVDEPRAHLPEAAVTGTGQVPAGAAGRRRRLVGRGGRRHRLLRALPAPLPVPVLLVLHRSRSSEAAVLERVLERDTGHPVREVGDKDELSAGTVHLAPPDYHVLVEGGSVSLSVEEHVNHSRPVGGPGLRVRGRRARGRRWWQSSCPASAATARAGSPRCTGPGGRTLVQDPDEAERGDMPGAAIATGAVDEVAPVAELGAPGRPRLVGPTS